MMSRILGRATRAVRGADSKLAEEMLFSISGASLGAGAVVRIAIGLGLSTLFGSAGAAQPPEDQVSRAAAAYQRGDRAAAIATLSEVLDTEPANVDALSLEALIRERGGELGEALDRYNRLIAELPESSRAHLGRGQVLFRLGRIEGSLADFDRVVELDSEAEPHLWQRGIAQYYAGRFAECKKQFETHRTVNAADVENAVWHFLCVARLEGIEAAREAILPVGDDPRSPMPEIYQLFRGALDVDDVLSAAGTRNAGDGRRLDDLFYARLYLGLFHLIEGRPAEAEAELRAAVELGIPHYMGDVARVQLDLLER